MYPFLIVLAIAGIDQLIKLQILSKVTLFDQIEVIKNFFYITYVKNYGIAFGMFQNKTLFFIITTAIIASVIVYLLVKLKNKNMALTICLSVILGGAIGNLVDRIRLGFVVDYLHFSFFPPVFNFADSCIVVGAIVVSMFILFDKNITI